MAALAALTAIALATAACGSEEKGGGGGGGTTTTFLGILSSDDASESGSVQVTVSTASPSAPIPTGVALVSVAANGSFKIVGGSTVTLTGTYDDVSGALDVSGGGYTFTGVFDGSNRLEGTYAGPSTTGVFVTARSDANTAAYCGTYAGDDQGVWDFVIDGNTLLGQAVSSLTGGSAPLDGSVNGNTITILFPGTQNVLATGTKSGNTVSGNWDDPNSTDAGTWSGTVCP
jgi:hypothetical protein